MRLSKVMHGMNPHLAMTVGVAILAVGAAVGWLGGTIAKSGFDDWRALTRSKSPPPAAPAQKLEIQASPSVEPTAETLAREQLADLRQRRATEEKEQDRLKSEAAHQKQEAERLEYTNRAVTTVDRLRQEYILGHDGVSAGILAGTEPLPEAWVNARLKAMNMPWVYRIVDSGTTLSPTAGNPYYKP